MSRCCRWISAGLLFYGLVLSGCSSQPFGKPFQHPDGHRVVKSPDGKLEARVIQVAREYGSNFESRVEIHSGEELLNSASYASSDGLHGRTVLKIGWTGNSQFFVYSTSSSGGGVSWQTDTFFYSRKHDKFFHLDDYIGPIVESDFVLVSSDTIQTRKLAPSGKLRESEPVTVRLHSLVPH